MLTKDETTTLMNLIAKTNADQARLFASILTEQVKRAGTPAGIKVGAKVRFKPRKTKPEVFGTVKSINNKTVTVVNCSDNGPGWRIPPHMLTVCDAGQRAV